MDAAEPTLSPAPETTTTATSLLPDLTIPYDLATRGQWQALFSHLSHPSHSHLPPQHRLLLSSLSALSLFKLRRFADCSTLLSSLPTATTTASPPFHLRLLHSLHPSHLHDRPLTLDRLYTLLSSIRSKLSSSVSAAGGDGGIGEWRRREALVVSLLCADHFAHREYDVVLALLGDLLERDPSNPLLLSKLAFVQLQIGDLAAAHDTFRRVESVAAAAGGNPQLDNLIDRSRALEFVVAKDWTAAIREYEKCIERDPADAVAINNKALCLMYSRDLGGAIKVLEGSLERVPTAALSETLVINLCSMYELAYVNHGDVKKSLAGWIAQVAPDDFDTSCTRM